MTPTTLRQENRHFCATAGVSRNNRGAGFRSAFCDHATGRVYLSRFADGKPAPAHLLDGLPDELIRQRDGAGRVTAVKDSVVAGFLRSESFYTRAQAAQALAG